MSGAAFYSRPFAGNKSPALWGFLGVGAAARGSAAAREGQETPPGMHTARQPQQKASFKKHPAAKANRSAGLLKSEGMLEKRMRQEYVSGLQWERNFSPICQVKGEAEVG